MTARHGRGPGAAATGAAYRLFSGRCPVLGFASMCAGVAILGTALFFFLHYLGNRIPYELAMQRFAIESDRSDEGYALNFKNRFEYCRISSAVLAGARKIDNGNPLVEAIVLKVVKDKSPDPNYCDRLKETSSSVDPEEIRRLETRYWWGSKALYGIALRYWSVPEIRELTRVSTWLAYGLLAVSLLLLSPGMLLIAAPLIVFGAFFSGVRYWADVANGTPYLWTVLSAAGLALLIRERASRWTSPEAVRLYCFAVGMVSSFLWQGDGHTFLAVTWIGLVVWFGQDHLVAPERTRRAVSCIVLYLTGFVACYVLGLLVKAVFTDGVWLYFWRQAVVVFDLTVSQDRVQGPERILLSFYEMAVGTNQTAGGVLTALSVLVLAGSVLFAIHQARRNRFDPLQGVLWIIGLMLINVPQFVIAEDIPYRTARFMFVPHALCLSCLMLVVMKAERVFFTMLIGVPLIGLLYAQLHFFPAMSRIEMERIVIEGLLANGRPVIRSDFDVYMDDNRLIFVKEECGDADVGPRFFLHVDPVDEASLPDHRKQYAFDNLDFYFNRHRYGPAVDGQCVAMRELPDYGITAIRTGQFILGEGRLWEGSYRFGERAD